MFLISRFFLVRAGLLMSITAPPSSRAFLAPAPRYTSWMLNSVITTTSRYSSTSNNNENSVGNKGTTTTTTTTTTTKATTNADSLDKQPRHDVGSGMTSLPPHIQEQMVAYQTHQQTAAKLDWATEIRTLVQFNHGFAVMSTFSKSDPDYPGGSVVGFAVDEIGRPVFTFSGMSTHTQDLLLNPHVSLTVASKEFKGAADARVNFMGRVHLIKDKTEQGQAKAVYMRKHPGAFWADFGDFNWFRMEVDKVRFVGGFARAGGVSAEEYTRGKPDAICEFGPSIGQHMNDDHMAATIAIVEAIVPGMKPSVDNPKITEALITSVDSLGMYVKVTRDTAGPFLPQSFKVRVPFPKPAPERKDVKIQIMELTQQAAASTKK